MSFNIVKITDDTFAFEEKAVRAYLLVGKEKALLIDSGCMEKDLKDAVSKVTDLPIVLINTHGDMDHLANNADFDPAYIHMSELEHVLRDWNIKLKFKPIWNGDVIDIGGRKIEVILVPGHTPGSICLLEKERRVLYSGDTLQNDRIVLAGNGRCFEAYRYSLDVLKARQNEFDIIYPSHDVYPIKPEVIDENIKGLDSVVKGEIKAVVAQGFGGEVDSYNFGYRVVNVDKGYKF